jgi:hypothetical protein
MQKEGDRLRRCNYCLLAIQNLGNEDIIDQIQLDSLQAQIVVMQALINDIQNVKTTISLINKTGSPSIKGMVVSASSSYDLSFSAQTNEYDAIGVVLEDGIVDGSSCKIVVAGKVQVLLKDGTSSTRAHVVFCADTDGRAITGAIPTPPNADSHFKEIGHCLESKDSGTNILAWCNVHFN